MSLRKNQQIVKERFMFETDDTGKLHDKSVYSIHRRYTEELGLLINEQETDIEEDCFL